MIPARGPAVPVKVSFLLVCIGPRRPVYRVHRAVFAGQAEEFLSRSRSFLLVNFPSAKPAFTYAPPSRNRVVYLKLDTLRNTAPRIAFYISVPITSRDGNDLSSNDTSHRDRKMCRSCEKY